MLNVSEDRVHKLDARIDTQISLLSDRLQILTKYTMMIERLNFAVNLIRYARV